MSKVYLIECNGLYKIGSTAKPVTKRLAQLQTGNPSKLQLVHTVERTQAERLEKQLHAKYKPKHVHLEWFALSDKDVQYIKTLANSEGEQEPEDMSPSKQKSTIPFVSADGHVLTTGDTVYTSTDLRTITCMQIDYVKTPEYVDGVLEWVAVSKLTTDPREWIRSQAWTNPRYLFKSKEDLESLLKGNE